MDSGQIKVIEVMNITPLSLFIKLPFHKASWRTNKLSKFNIKSLPLNRLPDKVIKKNNES